MPLHIARALFAVFVFSLQGALVGAAAFTAFMLPAALLSIRSREDWTTKGFGDFWLFGSIYAFALCAVTSAATFAISIVLRRWLNSNNRQLESYAFAFLATLPVAVYAGFVLLGEEGSTPMTTVVGLLTLAIVTLGSTWIGARIYTTTWAKLDSFNAPLTR